MIRFGWLCINSPKVPVVFGLLMWLSGKQSAYSARDAMQETGFDPESGVTLE